MLTKISFFFAHETLMKIRQEFNKPSKNVIVLLKVYFKK